MSACSDSCEFVNLLQYAVNLRMFIVSIWFPTFDCELHQSQLE